MKHLFIINPDAAKIKGRAGEIKEEIESFFLKNSQFEYDIHITRWKRDATGFVRRYVSETDEPVRVHCYGGAGTLFEVVNGAANLPNAEVAAYPMGTSNEFLLYFGKGNGHLFRSIRNQATSGTTPVDAIRCGNIHGISHALVGMEARSNRDGVEMLERTNLPADFCYVWPAAWEILTGRIKAQSYKIDVDGMPFDGNYMSINIANGPCYGENMYVAGDAHPNDGLLEVSLMNDMSVLKLLTTIHPYTTGQYKKIPDRIRRVSGKKIKISSDEVMCVCLDGETFYENSIEYEVAPHAIHFVCPKDIDITRRPRIYNHPEEGFVGDQ